MAGRIQRGNVEGNVMAEPKPNRGWTQVQDLVHAAGPEAEIGVAARLIGTERRWEIAGDHVFPAASTIKLAILVSLVREVEAGRLDLDQQFPVSQQASVGGSGVLGSLRPGLALTLADLAYLMIAISDNTASNVLLDLIGFDRVRSTIAALGLRGTALNRRFLGRAPAPDQPDNSTTAADLCALLTAIASDTAASPAGCATKRAWLAGQQNRDRLARRLPPVVTFGGKSGSLPGLVHDAGILTAPADSSPSRSSLAVSPTRTPPTRQSG